MTTTPTAPHSELDLVRRALGAEYEILEELGRGGMAIVYRAVERSLERQVAIKVLPSHFAFDENFVERFQREGRIAAQLEHPHIVPVYRVGRAGQVIFIIMKLLRGESLSDRIRVRGRLEAGDVRRVLMETGSALGYAAARGVVHRDIKPDNVIFDDDGRCVLTDFGIARSAAESKLTATGMSVGTPRYMSPEQARAKPLDGRSDIYSLGIVGYECLVGTTPFDGEDAFAILMDHIKAPVPRPALSTDDEWSLFEVIERMLAKEPDDRFQTADDLIAALGGERSATGRGAVYRAPARMASPTRPNAAIPSPDHPRAVDSGPRSSAALDHALGVGIGILRQQQPRVRVVIADIAAGAASARTYVISRGRRFWATLAAASVMLVASYYGVHFATKHRSHCPTIVASSAAAPGGGSAVAKPAGFSLLLDAVGTQSAGDDLDLYYDVCGLDDGNTYTAHVSVSKNESGLKRLLGRSPGPITVEFDHTAHGPASRRHETIDFSNMPAGSYALHLVVTDDAGRRRERLSEFQVR